MMKTATLQLEELHCPSCTIKLVAALRNIDGIDPATLNVSFNTSKVKVDFDETRTSLEDIQSVITRMGYEVLKAKVK